MLGLFGRKRSSSCHCIREKFTPYIDGRLKAAERREVKTHIAACSECCRELESMEATVQLLRRMPVAAAPRSFTLSQAPGRQVEISFGARVSDWLDAAVAAITPSAAKLKAATAIAAIALVVMVTGDLTGAFHTDGKSDSMELNAATLNNTEAEDTIAVQSTPSPDGGFVEAAPAVSPTDTKIATDQADNELSEVGPPPASDSSLSSNPFETRELTENTPADGGEAFSWLRPAEIALAALAFVLGCITLWNRRSKRSPVR